MNNPLYVRFKHHDKTLVFYVAAGCTLKQAIKDIEQETHRIIEKASYRKEEVE